MIYEKENTNGDSANGKVINMEKVFENKRKAQNTTINLVSEQMIFIATKILSGEIDDITGVLRLNGKYYSFYNDTDKSLTPDEFEKSFLKKLKKVDTYTK